jgi:hypothetical protein
LVKVLGTLRLKHFEQLINTGVISYMVSSDGCLPDIERMPRGLEDIMVDMVRFCISLDMADSPSLLWAAVMIAISSDSTMSSLPKRWVLLDRILDLKSFADWTWEKLLTVLQRYFWDDLWNVRGEACGERRSSVSVEVMLI